VQTRLAAKSGIRNYEGGTHVKLRSKVAAFAAAAGLAAGMLIVGGGGTAHAAEFLNCDRVSGTGSVKPGLSNVTGLQSISAASPKIPTAGQYPRTCTGTIAATTGPLVSVKGKLSGVTNCSGAPVPGNTDPVDGKFDLNWTTIVDGKALKTSTYIRLGAGETLDTFGVSNGIVTKGPGLGMDVEGDLLQAPIVTKNGVGTYSTLSALGTIVFGSASLDLGLSCQAGVSINGQPTTITSLIFSTDGTSLLGPTVDSSLSLTLPDPAP
jgi:hypothetical protein